MKGSIASKEMVYSIAAIVIIAALFTVFVRELNPAESPQSKALELANIVAADVNALSALKDKDGFVRVEQENTYDIGVVYYDKEFWPIEKVKHLYNWIAGELNFDKDGYYVVVTPYKEDERMGDSFSAFILNYPLDQDEELETSILRTSSVCISKKAFESLAKVIEC